MGKPKIRFKGYTTDWEQRKLSDIYGSIGNAFVGTATPYYAEQGHFYLESNNVKDGQINHNSEVFINDEFYEKQKDKWLHTGDMVMVQSGHVGHAAVIPEELDHTAAHALIMFRNPKEEIEPYFLNYEYQTDKAKKKIENITIGNTIKHILASDMKEFVVDVPKYEEQKVIAGYFCNLDHLITLHQRKCEETKTLKKYMLQKMFPQNGQSVPEIRFSGFTEDWEQRKLGDVCSRVQGNDGRMDLPTLTISAANGWMKQEDRFSGNIAGKEQKNYTLLHKGELSYNHGNSKLAKYGTVFSLQTYEEALVPRVYHSFKIEVGNTDFLEYYFATKLPDRELGKLISSGARMDGLLNIGYDEFMGIQMLFPSIAEQNRVASYFRCLDTFITLHQQKCEKLKNIKKFMLQNMFV